MKNIYFCLLAVSHAYVTNTPRLKNEICGGEITSDGIVTSPGFNNSHFYDNLDCTWEINIPDVSSIIIHPEVFHIEPASDQATTQSAFEYMSRDVDCGFDALEIKWKDHHGRNAGAKKFAYKFCSIDATPWWEFPDRFATTDSFGIFGVQTTASAFDFGLWDAPVKDVTKYLGSEQTYVGDFSAPLEIKGGYARVKFRTGPVFRSEPPRFELRIEAKTCNQVQTGSGTLTSPGWPENYNNEEKCKYTLNAEAGKIIKIVFDEFDVESSPTCGADSLTIMGQKYCGNSRRTSPKKVVMIYAESTELLWSTDNTIWSKGFSFSWESVDFPVRIQSAALESASAFNDHMEIFLTELDYKLVLRQPERLKALKKIWNNIQIAEQRLQTEGNCNIQLNYEIFVHYNVFDAGITICKNLQYFASNARQFLENFVCLDNDAFPTRTLMEWHNMVEKLENICRPFKQLPGGISALKKVDDEVKAVFEEIKAELQTQTGITGEFKILGYKTQIVAQNLAAQWRNYFIRCSSAGKFVHARVFKPFAHTNEPASVTSVLYGQSINKTSALEIF